MDALGPGRGPRKVRGRRPPREQQRPPVHHLHRHQPRARRRRHCRARAVTRYRCAALHPARGPADVDRRRTRAQAGRRDPVRGRRDRWRGSAPPRSRTGNRRRDRSPRAHDELDARAGGGVQRAAAAIRRRCVS